MTKVLITGSNGQLGSELKALAKDYNEYDFTFTDREDLDITAEDTVVEYFQTHNFDLCINCAAYTAVDKAEEDKELADLINVAGSKNLALGCLTVGATLIHISTDFVFNGNASRPLSEEDDTDPVNYYGLSKLNGEKAIQATLDKFYIIRTSWLYSAYGGNFVKTMLRLSETKDQLNIIADQIGSPTYAHDLAKAVLKIASKNDKYGIYHFSNEGVASWYDFTSAIFEYKGISTKVLPINTEQYPTPASRPHYSVMDKSKFRAAFGMEIPHWRQSLRACLEKL